MRSVALLCLAVLLVTAPAAAQDAEEPALVQAEESERQIYGYVDGRGAWHFVDSLVLVPVAYRAQASANATRVEALDGGGPAPARPAVTRRVVKREPEAASQTASQVADARRDKIAALRARRITLMESVAALEEGSAPAELVDADDGEALTQARLEEFLETTEADLERVERELKLLGGL